LPLALVLAAAWLTNAPAAIMIHYSLALLVVFFAWQRRSAAALAGGSGGSGAGGVPGGVLFAAGDLRAALDRHCAGRVGGIASGGQLSVHSYSGRRSQCLQPHHFVGRGVRDGCDFRRGVGGVAVAGNQREFWNALLAGRSPAAC
jgi:hypothetical protein